MKEFMMIFVGGDYETGNLSPDDFQKKMKLWNTWVEELKKDNLYVHGNALKNTATQIVNEDLVATNGPFVETNELITGFIVVKANDIEHAKSLTSGYPDFDLKGKVEIREIETFEE